MKASGCWNYFKQRPFEIHADGNDMPKYICCKCNSDDLNFLCYECENIYCDDCIKNINKHKCLMDVDKYEESYEDMDDFLDDNMIKLNKNSPRIELFPI